MTRPSIKVFYSYRRDEIECLERLLKLVEKLKDSFEFQHYTDREVAPPGSHFRPSIRQAMQRSNIIFLVLTREYMTAPECQLELAEAIRLSKRAVVVPVLGRKFETWKADKDLSAITWLPKDGLYSIIELAERDESKHFLDPLKATLRLLTQRLDAAGSSPLSHSHRPPDISAQLERIRSIFRKWQQEKPSPGEICSLINMLDEDNFALRKEFADGLRLVFQDLDQRDLQGTLECSRRVKGLIRFICTLEDRQRFRVKAAVREIQERELDGGEGLFSEGLVEILCWEPEQQDVELLERLFARASPEFQKHILRALPASPELPELVKRLDTVICCMDVRRVAQTRAGECSK